MNFQDIKQRFGIIGNSPQLNRSIDIARQIAPTDMSVLITGESGSGKEVFSQIIHQLSARKHGPFIAVNCGAIPEGTIDSELFGHEKGSFTGAHEARKGYFEVVNTGTIFLDEVAELPLGTQARLLRVLESGEYLRVGSSKVQKTDVRVIAATNVSLLDQVGKGKFREDLYYRLNTVPIRVPSLSERKEDIYLLFRKFIADFAEKYRMPPLNLNPEAQHLLSNFRWPGNVRQLKNIAEQMAVLEENREIDGTTLLKYLPQNNSSSQLPMLMSDSTAATGDFSERDLLYKVLFDMRKDMTELKKIVFELLKNASSGQAEVNAATVAQFIKEMQQPLQQETTGSFVATPVFQPANNTATETIEIEETLSLEDRELELIRKALNKHKGKRKNAAAELGISERTLYRKIKEYKLD